MTLCNFYHSFLYQQTGFFMHLSGKFENNSCPGLIHMTDFWPLRTACRANDVVMRIWTNCQMRLNPRLMPSFFIFKLFHPSYNALFHRANHRSWYLSMIIIQHRCGSMHVCLCFHPLKVLVFLIIYICHHLLGCYWIKFPLSQLSAFWLPTSFWSLWDVHFQVPCCESLWETKIREPQKLFLVPLFKVI